MKNFLLYISPFLVSGIFLSVALIFGGDTLIITLCVFLIIGFLSFLGTLLVSCYGD